MNEEAKAEQVRLLKSNGISLETSSLNTMFLIKEVQRVGKGR